MTSRAAWVKWVLLALLALLLWPPAGGFLFVNEAINATVARQVVLGARLYADAADWKGPLGYLIYAGVLAPTGFSLLVLACVSQRKNSGGLSQGVGQAPRTTNPGNLADPCDGWF